MSDLTCPECTEKGIESPTFRSPAGLGGHRKVVHGVEGESRSAADTRTRTKRRYKRRKPLPQGNVYVQWLANNPGTHSTVEIGAAVGAEATRVGKSLSASKVRGFPVVSDGRGIWHHTGAKANGKAHLPAVVAPQPLVEPGPAQVDGIQIFSVRRAFLLDTSEGLLIAEKLR